MRVDSQQLQQHQRGLSHQADHEVPEKEKEQVSQLCSSNQMEGEKIQQGD